MSLHMVHKTKVLYSLSHFLSCSIIYNKITLEVDNIYHIMLGTDILSLCVDLQSIWGESYLKVISVSIYFVLK